MVMRDLKFVSGIDTRGAAASCYFKSNGNGIYGILNNGVVVAAADGVDAITQDEIDATKKNQLFIFAECTSSLKVMANKVLEIVQ